MAFPSSSSASCSTLPPTNWDVFLSFRGPDTRYNFTSHLYSALDRYGIRTFMDDPELQTGEEISVALLEAIQESKTYIVILSENYASSSWCLDELVEILNCHNTMQRLVIPVFYKIDPAIVRHQTGSFKQALEKHESRLAGEMERVENWRLRLTQVTGKSGKHINEKRSEADIINEIVDEILLEINPMALDVAKYPVGLDSRVKGITTLLSSGTEGVVKIGIYGMGGVGKTTLAKALFNQLLLGSFKGSCFLANIREICGTFKGLETLQEQLINDVLKSKKRVVVYSVEHGTRLIKARICSTKILVVIDDLDDHKQFESLVGPFASGSIVIITTRDEEILDKIDVETKNRHRVNVLNDAESLALFSQHAFGNTKPDNTLMVLSEDILRHAGGLPLALEVFGSYLYKKSDIGWKAYIEKLQRTPNNSIQQRLIVSLDALDSDDPWLKKMFLDIACFFIGRKKEKAVEIMGTYYSYAEYNIDILKKRCLLTINNRDELRMHDLLQDMGKEVARNNSPEEPGKHSRLWVSKEICTVLKKYEGTEAIEGIMLHYSAYKDPFKEVSFDMGTFRKMSKLRFLYIADINLTGKFEHTLDYLRWFRWDRCPLKCLPHDFCPQELVSLELPHSRMTTMWEVSNVFKKLKTLNMSFSQDLTTTPDFTGLLCLESLNLNGCKSLEEVHMSIGSLTGLVSLNLSGCTKLRSLPDTICYLRAIKSLTIDFCSGLEEFPKELGNIESLNELNACGISVLKLPDSIGYLSKLVKLKLDSNKKLETLPNTICNLRALEVLSINDCTGLKALPIQLGSLESLTELNACRINVPKLPDSIGCLSNLVKLELGSNEKLETLPNTICNLGALEVLSINDCTNVEALPVQFGSIVSLRELNAERLTVSRLPDSIGYLSKLVDLKLNGNKNLESLPNTICNLRSLKILDIFGCERLEILPDQLWKVTSLKQLDVRGAIMLKKLPDIVSSQAALQLECLYLSESVLTALPSGLSQLSNLRELTVSDSGDLLYIADLPPNLRWFWADSCTSLEKLPNLSNLKQVEVVDLIDCSGLTDIQGLEELTSLSLLYLGGCCSSLLACTLTKRLFQIYSGFGHRVGVCIGSEEFPDWISQDGPATSLNLPPNNYLGLVLCFKCRKNEEGLDYSVKTSTGNLFRSDFGSSRMGLYESCMIIVPRSIFSVTDADHSIELTSSNAEVVAIHVLLSKLEDEYNTTTFDELKLVDPSLQDIFLDIACFFIGWNIEEVISIMETCYTPIDHYIDILKANGLLTTNNEDELVMHHRLQNIGRKIACNNSRNEPGKHSRLWLSVDIYDVLQNDTGTIAIEGIVRRKLDYQDALEGKSFTMKTLKRMSKLRFLYFKNVYLIGSFEHTLEDLRWLCWDECPLECLPFEFYPEKLVILELPHSKLRTMWEPNMVLHAFDKLKTLNMSYSLALTTTPDFTKLPCLETLNFEYCESLEEVHESIGSLTRLFSLNLHDCGNLETLPHTICNLKALKYLDIGGCSSLDALPLELGNIESLRELNAKGLNIWKLPDSVGRLSKLVELKLRNSQNLETLPIALCSLRALQVLSINGCTRLQELPMELGNIETLTEIKACRLSVSKLPDSIGRLSKLVQLRLSCNKNLETLPDAICNLSSLEILDISGCEKLEILPDQLWKLSSLRELNVSGATLLKKLPDIKSSQIVFSLIKLDLSESALTALPSGFSQLLDLSDLKLNECCDLLSIEELPPNLIRISADGCMSMDRLPNLSNLKQLEELGLTYCSGLTVISGLEELASIRVLSLEGCKSSLLAKHLFQIYFEFGHVIEIYAPEFPDWISATTDWNSESGHSQSSDLENSEMCLKLAPNVSHNLLGMILCFQRLENTTNKADKINYSVENITTHFLWSGCFYKNDYESLMVIVPRSIFPVGDGDEKIILTSFEADIHGIHLLYKTEHDSTTVNVEDERSDPSVSDLESDRSRFSLGSTTVNVEEETSHPSKRLKRL